jgi:hypothetical protein
MRKLLFAGIMLVVSAGWLACKKSKDNTDEEPLVKIDETRITDIEWKSENKGTPWYILKLNSDKTGYQKNIRDSSAATYFTYDFKWSVLGKDSIKISYTLYRPITFKIYAIHDTMLVMNNWIAGGLKDKTRCNYFGHK